MVFESAVSQLLNKYLGDFVDNLDANQLNIGIWGGDVELKDLVLKPSALDDLELPIQTVYGKIGKLVLKIPWKSLYTAPTVVTIEDVYLLAQPNQQVKYDPAKEDKKFIERKKSEIAKIEKAKIAEREKGKPKADAGFVEKLTQQIIKNIQLHVKNIHIRYEDEVTQPGKPFSLGITLSQLSVESTDSHWKKTITDDISKIYKAVQLDGLAVYWNCHCDRYDSLRRDDLIKVLQKDIASSQQHKAKGYDYILGPITASARLRMIPKPELEDKPFSLPVYHLNLDMGKLFVGISKSQYRDIIALADSMDRMAKGVPYRKYRPHVHSYKGHYKKWWKFAYKCVLEEEVRRKKRDWDWNHMLQYRNMCREYGDLYKKQIFNQKVPQLEKDRITECEKKLDLTNIVIIRQRIEMETEKLERIKKNEGSSWFGGWFGGSKSRDASEDELKKSTVILKQFEKEMTPEEKARLYKSIGYQENAEQATFPEEFVDKSMSFLLRSFDIELSDEKLPVKTVMYTKLEMVKVKFDTRAAAQSIKVHVQIDYLISEGLRQDDDYLPTLIVPEELKSHKLKSLVNVTFETNPIDKLSDQRVTIRTKPLRITYDAVTINKVVDVFRVPPDSSIDHLSNAAFQQINNVKEMTSTGLQYAIEQHTRLDLDIELAAPYIIVPYGGKYQELQNVLVINMGRIKIFSSGHRSSVMEVRELYSQGLDQEAIFERMKLYSYDHFKLELSDLQVLVAQGEEDWRQCFESSRVTPMHVLNPLSLSFQYSKCLITDDPRLPHNKVMCELPSIDITWSEARLLLLLSLLFSIPLPQSDEEPANLTKNKLTGSTTSLLRSLQENAKQTKSIKSILPNTLRDTNRKEFTQFQVLKVDILLSEIRLTVNAQGTLSSVPAEVATLQISSLTAELLQRTFDTKIQVDLDSIALTQRRDDKLIQVISTPKSSDDSEGLFKMTFVQVDPKSPDMHTLYRSCESSVTVLFKRLSLILHQEALLTLIAFAQNIQDNITELTATIGEASEMSVNKMKRTLSSLSQISNKSSKIPKVLILPDKKKATAVVVESIKFKVSAKLEEVTVHFSTDDSDVSLIAVRDVTSEVAIKNSCTNVTAKLGDIAVMDMNSETKHNLILSTIEEGGAAINLILVMNNLQGKESQKPDMDISVKMGATRIVFVNWFISNMLNFLNQFQAAQQAIAEASEAAAQVAKDSVKDAYQKATKVSLNVRLKAPQIIVPLDSQSLEALYLDLGVITITNKFLILDIKNQEGFSAVIDDMKVSLTEVKASRVYVDAKEEVVEEVELLEQVCFSVNIKRNLSAGWYKAIPDLEISGTIKNIGFHISQADYGSIMSVLSGNLTEGKVTEAPHDALLSKTSIVTKETITSAIATPRDSVVGSTGTDVTIFLKFTFSMEHLTLNLYSGTSKKISPGTRADHQLGKFSLEGLSVKGRILSDQSLVTSILLVNILLDDMRKGREGKLKRLIERSHVENEYLASSSEYVGQQRSMIDVTFQQRENDIFADVRVYSFTVIVSVEYLMKIGDIFNPQQTSKAPKVTTGLNKSRSAVNVSEKKTRSATVHIDPLKEDDKPPPQMTLNLKVEKPDIILVEHMDSIDTQAMILNSEILVKFRTSGNHQVINGLIKDLQLYTCNYNPAKRAETKGNILHPVTISLAGSTPEHKGLHVELMVEEVVVRVSPATIELVNKVLVTLSQGVKPEDDEVEEQFVYGDIWNARRFKTNEFWFLKRDVAVEATEEFLVCKRIVLQELCLISMTSLVVTIEAGVGNKTLPMLLFEASLKGKAKNWTSQLGVEASLTVQMGYYNSRLALWEPLIEPVERKAGHNSVFEPWELRMELAMCEPDDTLNHSSPTSEEESTTNQPVMSIDVISESTLELTVTKTCLEVLQNLGKAFASAMKSDRIVFSDVLAPYRLINTIGEDISLPLDSFDQGSFMVAPGGSEDSINKPEGVPLVLKETRVSIIQLGQELNRSEQDKQYLLHVKFDRTNVTLRLPVVRADKRFFMINEHNWGVISDVKMDEGVMKITIRSIVQVFNHFSVPIDVYYMTARGNELELVGTVEPNDVFNLPLKAVYTPTNELFFGINGYAVTTTPYIWRELRSSVNVMKILKCPVLREIQNGKTPFIIKAVGEMEQVYYEDTTRYTMASTCYNIHLRPAAIFKNFLPLTIVVCVDELEEEIEVKAGDTLQLPNVDPGKSVIVIRIPEYLEKEWSCRKETEQYPMEFEVWTFHSYDSPTKRSLDLGMHTVNKNGSLIYSLYCPFWMLNKTGLMIGYRKSKKTEKHEAVGSPLKTSDENLNVLHHPANFKGPILFSFNAKNFFGKKKASIRVEAGDWSDKFSIDVAGSEGVVSCKTNNLSYQIGVHNQLTYNSLTKQVTFTPYYVIINNAPYAIECQESDRPADPWTKIEPKSCSALWPKSEMEDKLLKVRIVGTDQITAPFLYTESHTTLLKLTNKYGGINVDIQLTEGAVYINLAAYNVGCAPALLINHTNKEMTFWEKESITIRKLLPKQCMYYTWENPSGPRKIVWEKSHKNEIENDLRKDGCGNFFIKEQEEVFWSSFLDGMQRVLLFTPEKAIAQNATNIFEIIQQEITLSLHGVGLSLVNNITRQEIMYIGIASSGVIWETCKPTKKKFRPLSTKESTHIENAYQNYLVKIQSSHSFDDGKVNIDDKIDVDFDVLQMYKPHKRKLRRTFQTGVWLQMKTSPSQMQLHAKINRLQLDNQMYDCIFPVVIAPIPPPKSVALDSGIKPFVEVSIVQLLTKHSQVIQYKYFKVLVQEFHIKVDLGFVNALMDLMQQAENNDDEDRQLFIKDMDLVNEALYAHASGQAMQEQKSFYDLLHFSPLKIHVSFSLAAGTSAGQSSSTPNVINVLLQGVGVTLTDLQDVVFKLAFFERDYTFLTQKQLVSEATSHYVGQLVKQLYVLVLGLDVIGNPYGLVIGIGKGVEDLFYEPFQGAIQGPSEFAEGLALGVKSLAGHVVGGVMGAATRITGAMGKGIAALTFDDDFQRKRRDQMNKKPQTVHEGFARSGKGLVMGVFDGVTGVFTKPVSGAKEQGVEGFFKGLGKGAVGLVARPAAGIVDFASGSLDAVKRVAEWSEETSRLRPPRFLPADGLVRPYNVTEAEGNKILIELCKGKYAATDVYVYHKEIGPKKDVLLLTDKRLAYIEHNDLFGGWQVDWSYTWQELNKTVSVVPKGLNIPTPEKKKKLFGSGDSSKVILIDDPAVKEELCFKIESLRSA